MSLICHLSLHPWPRNLISSLWKSSQVLTNLLHLQAVLHGQHRSANKTFLIIRL